MKTALIALAASAVSAFLAWHVPRICRDKARAKRIQHALMERASRTAVK